MSVHINNLPSDPVQVAVVSGGGGGGEVTVSNFPTLQNVNVSSTSSAVPVFFPVAPTVAVSNLPVTQPISGSVTVSNLVSVLGTVGVNNFPTVYPISGDLVVAVENHEVPLNVNVSSSSASLAVFFPNVPQVTIDDSSAVHVVVDSTPNAVVATGRIFSESNGQAASAFPVYNGLSYSPTTRRFEVNYDFAANGVLGVTFFKEALWGLSAGTYMVDMEVSFNGTATVDYGGQSMAFGFVGTTAGIPDHFGPSVAYANTSSRSMHLSTTTPYADFTTSYFNALHPPVVAQLQFATLTRGLQWPKLVTRRYIFKTTVDCDIWFVMRREGTVAAGTYAANVMAVVRPTENLPVFS